MEHPFSASHSGELLEEVPQSWKLVLAYDGTDFNGWQIQPGQRTIQGVLAETIRQVLGERVLPQGSGRTDAGVHAEGQVVSLQLTARIPSDRLCSALNRKLPSSIRVLSASPAPAGFHARSGVLQKTYEYRVFCRRRAIPGEQICSPFLARYVWNCTRLLNAEAMNEAASAVIGNHDFTSFMATDPDRARRIAEASESGGPVSNVRRIFTSLWSVEDSLLRYRVSGSGFLHHMVRNLVGTFVEVGIGRRQPEQIPAILSGRDRALAGMTAPPQGLFLMHVQYAEEIL